MPYLLNLLYALLLLALAPVVGYKMLTAGKYRRGLLSKLLGLTPVRDGSRPCVWFHAVSVGEVLLLRQVISRFRTRHPEYDCLLSTTTNTGYDVAVVKFPELAVFWWPFDFTWAVKRALRHLQPSLVVLSEMELWPNFLIAAARRQVPVAVINGRMTQRSYRGYRWLRGLLTPILRHIRLFAVQTEAYAENLRALGLLPHTIHVTGSVKYDGAALDRHNPKTEGLRQLLLGKPSSTDSPPVPLIWIAGSTQAPEEQIALGIYGRARERFPNLRLILVPRHAERFGEVASLIQSLGFPLIRRTELSAAHPPNLSPCLPVMMMDTLGELGALWGLADLAFVGGSLSGRGGQNMIEPAGFGVAVTFGPDVWNFQETVDRLLEHRGAIQVKDAVSLERETLRLLGDQRAREALGRAAQEFVLSQQGATERTLDLLALLLPGDEKRAARAA